MPQCNVIRNFTHGWRVYRFCSFVVQEKFTFANKLQLEKCTTASKSAWSHPAMFFLSRRAGGIGWWGDLCSTSISSSDTDLCLYDPFARGWGWGGGYCGVKIELMDLYWQGVGGIKMSEWRLWKTEQMQRMNECWPRNMMSVGLLPPC